MSQTDQVPHDRQTKTGAAGIPDTRWLYAVEPLKHASQIGPAQNLLNPPPVPDMPTVTLAPRDAIWNSSATASVIGNTVLESSIAITLPPVDGSPPPHPAITTASVAPTRRVRRHYHMRAVSCPYRIGQPFRVCYVPVKRCKLAAGSRLSIISLDSTADRETSASASHPGTSSVARGDSLESCHDGDVQPGE